MAEGVLPNVVKVGGAARGGNSGERNRFSNSEDRRPKAEGGSKPDSRTGWSPGGQRIGAGAGFRISGLGLSSAFGLRISDFLSGGGAALLALMALNLNGVIQSAHAEEMGSKGLVTRTNTSSEKEISAPEPAPQNWNWHLQNTTIVQGYPGFTSPYAGPNSLPSGGEVRESISLDLMAGVRLWRGAEAHVDGLMWQGFGIGQTFGIEGFPNGEAFCSGTAIPNVNFSRVLVRQTINLGGGATERVEEDPLHLASVQDVAHLTLTAGRMSVKDIFDNNAYANDARTEFLNWAFTANEAWDYPADSLGYTTGAAAELYVPNWAFRYGFFQVPRVANGTAEDPHYLEAWGMVTEVERRYRVKARPGAVRLLAFLNRANMGSFQEALDSPARPADIMATRAYRLKYGFGLNVQQELTPSIGTFLRLGWNNGAAESWMFADVDRTATLGLSVKGASWGRPNDTFGLAGGLNGVSRVHRDFFAAGGLGLLAGDGTLTYGWEQLLETYYDVQIWKTLHGAVDYQFVSHPAYNRDRGPVSVFAARLHWEF